MVSIGLVLPGNPRQVGEVKTPKGRDSTGPDYSDITDKMLQEV